MWTLTHREWIAAYSLALYFIHSCVPGATLELLGGRWTFQVVPQTWSLSWWRAAVTPGFCLFNFQFSSILLGRVWLAQMLGQPTHNQPPVLIPLSWHWLWRDFLPSHIFKMNLAWLKGQLCFVQNTLGYSCVWLLPSKERSLGLSLCLELVFIDH